MHLFDHNSKQGRKAAEGCQSPSPVHRTIDCDCPNPNLDMWNPDDLSCKAARKVQDFLLLLNTPLAFTAHGEGGPVTSRSAFPPPEPPGGVATSHSLKSVAQWLEFEVDIDVLLPLRRGKSQWHVVKVGLLDHEVQAPARTCRGLLHTRCPNAGSHLPLWAFQFGRRAYLPRRSQEESNSTEYTP